MKRYYYTDALAAAWMAREFGFKYIDRYTCDETGKCLNYTVDWKVFQEGDDLTSPIAKYELHPDSLPLLEPKGGDIVMAYSNSSKSFRPMAVGNPPDEFGCTVYHAVCELNNGLKIIQRDNKAFFMPECEES